MNVPAFILLGIAGIYLVSAILFMVNFVRSGDWAIKLAKWILYAGFLFSTLFIFFQSNAIGFCLPVTSLYQALFFFSWSMLLIYLLLSWRIKLDTFGLVLVPLIFVMTLGAFLVYKNQVNPMRPYLSDKWFAIHVVAAFLAYASFALSFVGALLYMVQNRELKIKRAGTFYHKLPPLEILETVVYRAIVRGFPLLTIALVSGFIWTKDRYGVFWRWDPKFIFSILTWIIYFVILYVHYISSFRGRKVVVISIVAFGFVLVTFLGVNFFEGSVHHNFLK